MCKMQILFVLIVLTVRDIFLTHIHAKNLSDETNLGLFKDQRTLPIVQDVKHFTNFK